MSNNIDDVTSDPTSGYPYNRIVQWSAGPISSGMGLLFSWLAVHQHVVLPDNVKNSTIEGVVAVGTFGISAAVTYAAHHKWFTNLAHWFFSQEQASVVAPPVAADDVDVEEPADVAGIDEVSPASS